jgi:hypothetical protein
MNEWFDVDELDVERLLIEWRWLYPRKVVLVARSAFGDLFLRDGTGAIVWLGVSSGRLKMVAENESKFRELAAVADNQLEWFAETDAQPAMVNGVRPGKFECIAFKIPLAFSEGRHVSDNTYIIDIYEGVSVLGDIHRQISKLPNGARARLVTDRKPTPPAS